MNFTPPRRLKENDWVLVGHNVSINLEAYPPTPRAAYSFQSRVRHIYKKSYKSKSHDFDCTFPMSLQFKDTEFFRKFPARRVPPSVRSKRPTGELVDFLGTQMIFVPNKKVTRFY